MIDPLPDAAKIFSSVLQQERQWNTYIPHDPAKILYSNNNNTPNFGKFQQRQVKGCGKPNFQGKCLSNFKFFSFCGKTGHTLDTCYLKHGFPPGFKFKDKIYSTNYIKCCADDSE